MAAIFILLGSLLGFFTGITLYFGFDAGLATALLVWGASGPLSALVVIGMSFQSDADQTDPSDDQVAETA